MEWISVIKTLEPVLGPLAAILVALLFWEKMEHRNTRKQLVESYKERLAEQSSMTKVIDASSTASSARAETTREQTQAFNQLTTAINLLMQQINHSITTLLSRR